MNITILEAKFGIEKTLKKLKQQYPLVSAVFNATQTNEITFPECFVEFFELYGLKVTYGISTPLKKELVGTYHYCIKLNEAAKVRLERKRDYRYYGISSKYAAEMKMLEQSFKIMNCLIKDISLKEIPKRRTKKNCSKI